MRTIPPLNPLHVFETSARLGNFTKAAEELGVTQSAVSRQIATLEESLGMKLFKREHKGIALTVDGQAYFREISPAFARIASATDSLIARRKTNAIRVAAYPTFSAKWLIPRLARFNATHQNIQVKLKTSILPVNFDISPFDVAIQLRPVEEMDPEFSALLFWDVIQPYCSPAFLDRHRLERPDDLFSVPLLASYYRRSDWQDWMAGVGLGDRRLESNEFPSSLLTYKAAAEGLGAAIGQPFLMEDEIASGTLVPIFTPVQRNLAHFIMWNRYANARVRNFVRWVREEVSASNPSHGPVSAS
ncbi:LysR family transcriptional regulator [Telmatospirillum sp. J64-1]|uniref:LysR family transcriptional regulator n=1 Tax=Telmatospirillum sp. J64-1 TaxID=2502183 RepID=UPI00115D2C24|nr:LysR family transcriptional regulator [Telmatospirillum sp. J64-1]